MTLYVDAGVNIDLGDDASRVLYEAARKTWENRKGKLGEVVELFPDFSGLRAIHVGGLPKGTYMNLSFDGVGTKMELGERIGKHDTVAYDLFAMVCDDAVVRGAEPVIVGSILDIRSLGSKGKSYIDFVKELAVGYIGAAKKANVAVVNGEIAELGARVNGFGEFNYNWGAGVVWFGHVGGLLSGYEIREGDSIVSLREEGFRSNGLSLFRKIAYAVHGDNWHEKEFNGKSIAELALTPSRIYAKAVVDMFGGIDGERKAEIHGVCHITGGGIPGKLGRALKPSGLSAFVDPYQPSDFILHVQDMGNTPDREAYKTWNMGQGMLIITPEPDKVIKVASGHGIQGRLSGEILKTESPKIVIVNKGVYHSKELELTFPIE